MINIKYSFRRMQPSILRSLFVSFALLICFVVNAQYDIPPKPKSDLSLIFNYSSEQIISAEQQHSLNRKLIEYEAKTSTQIALVIIPSLKDEDPNLLATQWAHEWGIGQKGKDNGMMILMSTGDRKIAIQNGYGLEEYMTDARSRQVIYNIIIPEFKRGNYYKGFNLGVDAIIDILDGKFVEDNKKQEADNVSGLFMVLMFLAVLLFIIWLASKGGNGNDRDNFGGGKRRSPFEDIIFTDFGRSTWSGRGGGFGGGGFSGGFGGFGGGGFGGGGASGGW